MWDFRCKESFSMMDRPKFTQRVAIALGLREPPHVPPYGWSYFDHMAAVYRMLDAKDARAAKVLEKAAERPYGMTWGDIFLLENIIFSLQPEEVLARNSWMVRERFRQIAGPEMYGRYVDTGIPTKIDTPGNVALLKADLSRVLDFLHWYYALIPIRERSRRSLTERCIRWVIVYTIVLMVSVITLHFYHRNVSATIICVLYFGIIGGFVSSLRRMQSIPTDGDPLISVFGFENAGYFLFLSPLLGAIFATILTLLFLSGILTGPLFPGFPTPPIGEHFMIFRQVLPQAGGDFAKLFVWCFLAGFAERLVPDSLDRLALKLDPGTPAAPSGPPVSPTDHVPGATAQVGAGAEGEPQPVAPETPDDAQPTGDSANT
jgi:hypothetical protein